MDGYAGSPVRARFPENPDEDWSRSEGPSGARIIDQLHHQSENIEKANAILSALEERLSPILMSVPVPGEDPNMKRAPGDSDLSTLIDRNNGGISMLQRRIGILIERMQL